MEKLERGIDGKKLEKIKVSLTQLDESVILTFITSRNHSCFVFM